MTIDSEQQAPPMTQTPELLEVIQSDYERAVDLCGYLTERLQLEGPGKHTLIAELGKYFARHRIEHATPSPVSVMREEHIARAIADGFSNGNEQFEEASVPQQERYIEAARAVIAALPLPDEA